MVDSDNRDDEFEPFDDDGAIPDVPIEGGEMSPFDPNQVDNFLDDNDGDDISLDDDDDLLLDDTPQISEDKKKNIVLLALGLLVVVYFVYKFTLGDNTPKPQKEPTTEIERMQRKGSGKVSKEKLDIPKEAIKKDEEIDPNEIIPPAPPPPVIDVMPEDDLSENSGFGGEGLPALGDESGGNFNGEGNPSQPPPFADPFAGNNNNSNQGALPGLPPLDDDFGEPPGVIRQPRGNNSSLPPLNKGSDLIEKQNRQAIMQRMNAGMMLVQGVEPRQRDDRRDDEEEQEEIFELNTTSAERSDVTKTWHLDSVILQGKVMDAVLETAINTDLPGRLRAIIARDVYAEQGKRILIPKGSRLIGAFQANNDFKFGRSRVLIVWTRVIRPDGIDALFDEGSESLIATDFLGRPGVVGELDNRFADIFGSAVLLSSLTIAFAAIAEEVTGAQNNTQVGTQGNVIDQSSPTAQAVREAVFGLQGDARDVTNRLFEKQPRITIDQGTRIKIFVNRDVRFPRPVENADDGPINIIN